MEAARSSTSKPPPTEQNESHDANSLTMRRLKHNTHHSISNPQGLVEELKGKNKNSFTSSFQRLLTTYKKSKESHKSVSYGGGQSEALLPKSRNNIFAKHKTLTKVEPDKEREKKLQKSQKILTGKKYDD